MPKNPGRQLYSPQVWQWVGQSLQLSPRELEITQAIFDDLTEEEMAKSLGISAHTIHTYLKRIYQKLGASSRVEVCCIVVAAAKRQR